MWNITETAKNTYQVWNTEQTCFEFSLIRGGREVICRRRWYRGISLNKDMAEVSGIAKEFKQARIDAEQWFRNYCSTTREAANAACSKKPPS